MAKKKYLKRTAEERARQRANVRWLRELIERRLERDGATREEIERRLGLPTYRRRSTG